MHTTKVQEAAGRLEHYKQEEAVLIDQMDRIEDRALQLQEQLKRLRDEHAFSGETGYPTD
jgi:predicted nuclease with TOPRIM domain